MRVVAAFVSAAFITLALFTLMQYLTDGVDHPRSRVDVSAGVDLIRLRHNRNEHESVPTRRSPGTPHQLPAEAWSPSDLVAVDIEAPELPELLLKGPEMAPVELGEGPYLDSGSQIAMVEQPPRLSDTKAPVNAVERSIAKIGAADETAMPAQAPSALDGVASAVPGIGEDGNDAVPLLRFEPIYPRKAARARQEGWVKVEFTITEEGSVVDAVVVDSQPRRIFNRSALKAIRKWQFKPKVVDGEPVPRRAAQVIEFKLAGR